jgi:chemotaxis protein histidine kinase CheA
MSEDRENQKEEKSDDDEQESTQEQNDLETYLSDMKNLETDFSDLEDLDLEELKEMQEAIAKVKELESLENEEAIEKEVSKELELIRSKPQISEREEYIAQKEAMISDFSDLEEIDFDELQDMQKAIETVKQEDSQLTGEEILQTPVSRGVSSELEERIKQELIERKKEKAKEIITPEKFIERAKNKRNKIWYHSLYYLVYQAEDSIASKVLLYDMLKEVTSKSPIDPIPENQFYFGLGYILRLTLNDKQVVRYMKGGKFKINIGIKGIREILEEVGEPISTRPILKEEEKKKMYTDFLKDNFLGINN